MCLQCDAVPTLYQQQMTSAKFILDQTFSTMLSRCTNLGIASTAPKRVRSSAKFYDTPAIILELPICSRKQRRCILDAMVSPMVCMIHRQFSRTVLRNIGDTVAMLLPECSVFSYLPINTPTKQRSSLLHLFIHDLFRSHKTCGSTYNLSTFYMITTRHYTIATTSSRNCHDIVNTLSPMF